MPGMTLARAVATPSKVLWLSLSTITIQLPPRADPGSVVRGRSTVVVSMPGIAFQGRRRQPARRRPLIRNIPLEGVWNADRDVVEGAHGAVRRFLGLGPDRDHGAAPVRLARAGVPRREHPPAVHLRQQIGGGGAVVEGPQ